MLLKFRFTKGDTLRGMSRLPRQRIYGTNKRAARALRSTSRPGNPGR
jgi:hypothetical protein